MFLHERTPMGPVLEFVFEVPEGWLEVWVGLTSLGFRLRVSKLILSCLRLQGCLPW